MQPPESLSETFVGLSEREIAALRLAAERELARGDLGDLKPEALSALEKLRQTEPRGC